MTRAVALRVVGVLLVGHVLIAALNLSPLIDSYTVSLLLDVNLEGTMVVWLSSATLLVIAALAFLAGWRASAESRVGAWWRVIGAGFVLLSLDETASLHERIGEKAARVLEVDWLPSLYLWVIVLGPIAMLAAVWMLRWFGGTLGWRSVQGRLATVGIALWMAVPVLEALDPTLGGPRLLVVIEETAEGFGEALMLGALLLHLAARRAPVEPAPAPPG
ncbi:MAG: hypothetical protein AAB198_06715 [Actinomycetota bacterium]